MEPALEQAFLGWGEALLASGSKSQALALFENDARRYPAHLLTSFQALKLRLSMAESTNQFIAIGKDLGSFEKALTARMKEKRKRLTEFSVDIFEGETLQRAATELRIQIQAQIPSPRPSVSPSFR